MDNKKVIHPKIKKTEVFVRTLYDNNGITEEVEETILLPSALFESNEDGEKKENDKA